MQWTALVPIKPPGARKSRLAGRLGYGERDVLAEAMFVHVLGVLAAVPGISEIHALGASAGQASIEWIIDEGRGLNGELTAARVAVGARPLLVIHADLPLLRCDDVAAMLAGGEGDGAAIAPDRHGTGTNALAIADGREFGFAFGPNSFARHCAAAGGRLAVVERLGLALDCDTPADLDLALGRGFCPAPKKPDRAFDSRNDRSIFMSEFSRSTTLNAAPASVFAFVSDIANLPRYAPTARMASTDGHGHVHVEGVAHGQAYTNDGQLYVDPATRVMRWGSGKSAYRGELRVDDGANGGSEVELKLHFNSDKGHVPADREIEQGLSESLARLKAAVEG